MNEPDEEDKVKLMELTAFLKQKHGWDNVVFHYEDKPEEYWYIETKVN